MDFIELLLMLQFCIKHKNSSEPNEVFYVIDYLGRWFAGVHWVQHSFCSWSVIYCWCWSRFKKVKPAKNRPSSNMLLISNEGKNWGHTRSCCIATTAQIHFSSPSPRKWRMEEQISHYPHIHGSSCGITGNFKELKRPASAQMSRLDSQIQWTPVAEAWSTAAV